MRLRLLVVLLPLAGCGSTTTADAGTDADAGTSDAGTSDAGTDAGTSAGTLDAGSLCLANPTTHLELINACTTATAIVRTPSLPLLQADGGVPPLP
jgi:uncharacterized protein YceK